MTEKKQSQTKTESKAPLLSLAAVLLDAIIIAVFALVAGPESVMYFGAFLLVGDLIGHEFYLRVPRRSLRGVFPGRFCAPMGFINRLLCDHQAAVSTVRHHLYRARLWVAVSRLNYPLLVAAVSLSSPITAALVYSSFTPILSAIGFRRVLEKRRADYQRHSGLPPPLQRHITLIRWFLVALAVIGAVLMILATGSNGDGQSGWLPVFNWGYLAGVGAGLAAAVGSALILFANRWADRTHAFTANIVTASKHAALKRSWLALYIETQAIRIVVLPVIALTLALDIFGVIPTPSFRLIVFALLAGLLIRTPTQTCLRTAYTVSGDAALPAIESALPFVSFVVLGSLGLADVTHWAGMVIGLLATTAGLVLLQTKVGWRN